MTVWLKVINRKWAMMMHMRIKCQHQCWTLLHQPNTRMATTMNPTLVAFGTFEPPLQIQIVCWKIGPLSPQTTPAQNCSSPWQTAGAWGQCLPATPPAARRIVPHAPPLWLRRSASGGHRLLAGPGHSAPLASRPRGRPLGRGQYNRPAASTAPLHAPFFGVKVAIQRLAYLL